MLNCSSCGRPLTGEGRFCAACGTPQAVAPGAAMAPVAPAAPAVGQAPPPVSPPRQPFPGWAVAFFVILVISAVSLFALFVVPFLIVGSVLSAVDWTLPADVHAAEVRAGARTIERGVEAWRADHASGRYPPAALVTPEGLGKYVDPWPEDPYNGGPMLPTGVRGGYTYTRGADGLSFTLTAHDDAGTPDLPFP
jgi:hypothetical protein